MVGIEVVASRVLVVGVVGGQGAQRPQSSSHEAQSSPSYGRQTPSWLQVEPQVGQSPGQLVQASQTHAEQKPSPQVGGGGQSMGHVTADSP